MRTIIRAVIRAKRNQHTDISAYFLLRNQGYDHFTTQEAIDVVGVYLPRAKRAKRQLLARVAASGTLLSMLFLIPVGQQLNPNTIIPEGTKRTLSSNHGVVLYVSTTGNDSNPGTLSQPLATIGGARAAVAALPDDDRHGVTVYVRGGTYRVTSGQGQVNFNAAVSGTEEDPNIFANYPGEYPTFTQFSDVTVPAGAAGVVSISLSSGDPVQSVYSGSVRQELSRAPNYTTPVYSNSDPWAGNFAFVSDDTPATVGTNCPGKSDNTNYCELRYTAGSDTGELADPSGWATPTAAKVMLFTGGATYGDPTAWTMQEFSVASINTTTRTIRLTGSTGYVIQPHHFFYVRNVSEELNTPGEWHQSGSTLSYYRPLLAEEATLSVLATTSYTPFVVSGSNLIFRGLSFTGFGVDPSGGSSWLMRVSGASNVVFDGLDIGYTETTGLLIADGSTSISVQNSRIHDTQQEAIKIPVHTNHLFNLTDTEIVIQNNSIWNIGLHGSSAVSAILANEPYTVIRNNSIWNTVRAAVGGGAGSRVTIENNTITNANLLTADSGSITFLPVWTGSARSWIPQGHLITNNYIGNTGGYSWKTDAMKYGIYTWGVYLDDFTSGTTVRNNIITDFSLDCLMNHGGRDNLWENNICYTTRDSSALARFREDPQPLGYGTTDSKWTEVQDMAGLGFTSTHQTAFPNLLLVLEAPTASQIQVNNIFRKNILVSTATTAPQYLYGKNLATNNTFENNIIKTSADNAVIEASINAGVANTYATLADWQVTGFDVGSTFSDPQFTDASDSDFSLTAGSPALTRGFQQIDQTLYNVKQVLPAAPDVTAPDEATEGEDVAITWSVTPPTTYPLTQLEYQVRTGSSSGSAVTAWVSVLGTSGVSLSDEVFDSVGNYAVCVRAMTDIRQPTDGATNVWSSEGCETFTIVAEPGEESTPTPTPEPTASSSETSPPTSSVTASPTSSSSPKARTTANATTKATPRVTASSTPSAEVTPEVSASPTPSVVGVTRSSSSPSGGVESNTQTLVSAEDSTSPFSNKSAGTLRIIILAGTLLSTIGAAFAFAKWMGAVGALQRA